MQSSSHCCKKKKRKTFVLLSTCNKRIQWLFLCCSGATDGSLRPSFTHMKVCLRVSDVLFSPSKLIQLCGFCFFLRVLFLWERALNYNAGDVFDYIKCVVV